MFLYTFYWFYTINLIKLEFSLYDLKIFNMKKFSMVCAKITICLWHGIKLQCLAISEEVV